MCYSKVSTSPANLCVDWLLLDILWFEILLLLHSFPSIFLHNQFVHLGVKTCYFNPDVRNREIKTLIAQQLSRAICLTLKS
jgi:hypothetical protein